MVSASIALLAAATLVWPAAAPAHRLRWLCGRRRAWFRRRTLPRPTTFVVALLCVPAGWLLGGAGGAVAAGLAGATLWRRWRAQRELRHTLSAVDGLADAVRSLVADLRAGAHPADAAEAAAGDAEPRAAAALRSIAAAARLDGDLDRALAASRRAMPATAPVLGQLRRAWIMAKQHGVPLAEVLDAVRHDLTHRARFARRVVAKLAGPRASATVLALLPVLGLALGEAMGAHPWHVLTSTASGQGLLALGVALLCAGLVWSARITERVVLR